MRLNNEHATGEVARKQGRRSCAWAWQRTCLNMFSLSLLSDLEYANPTPEVVTETMDSTSMNMYTPTNEPMTSSSLSDEKEETHGRLLLKISGPGPE